MRPPIKVKVLLRILGQGKMPVGEIFQEYESQRILSQSVGESVIDLRTGETVYIFNKEEWAWIPSPNYSLDHARSLQPEAAEALKRHSNQCEPKPSSSTSATK